MTGHGGPDPFLGLQTGNSTFFGRDGVGSGGAEVLGLEDSLS
jgi:hypothetical protein